MPNYFYVKNGGSRGTADTPYTTMQTGAFPSSANCYDNIAQVFSVATTPPTLGDFILVSDVHSHSYSGAATYLDTDQSSLTSDLPLVIMSVDDTACQNYKRATSIQEQTGSNGDLRLTGTSGDDQRYVLAGLYLQTDDDMFNQGNGTTVLIECTLRGAATGDTCVWGVGWFLIDCTLIAGGNSATALWSSGFGGRMQNCVFQTDYTGATGSTALINPSGSQAARIIGCDMSASKALYVINPEYFSHGNTVIVENCQLPTTISSLVNAGTSHGSQGNDILITGSASSSAAAEYQYYFFRGGNTLEDETGIYRDASETTPGGAQLSYKAVTVSGIGPALPFVFTLPTMFMELSNASTDTIRIHLASTDATLTDKDVRIAVYYPDGTVKNQYNTAKNADIKFTAAGTALDITTSEAWTNLTTETRYYIDIDTSGDVGADSVPTIIASVTKPSTTIYFCSTPELVA